MNQRPRLLFRADGNAQIGLGHLMRCLALANILGNGYDRWVASVQPAPEVVVLIEKAGVNVLALASADEALFLAHVKSTDILVLDGYDFGHDYQLACRSAAWALVYIDDLCSPDPVANVIINHAGGLTRSDYYSGTSTSQRESTLLLGPEYALLRPAFLNPDGFGAPPADGPVLVSLGGSDPQNASATVLEAIRQTAITQSVRLIVGPLYAHLSTLNTMAEAMPNVQLLTNLSASQMAEQWQVCRLAIVSCSTVAYEVCAIGRPFIGLQTADNQSRLRAFFEQQHLAAATLESSAPIEALAVAIYNTLTQPADTWLATQRRFFDGRSPDRFRALFTRLCSAIA